jgi:hypothetical protein
MTPAASKQNQAIAVECSVLEWQQAQPCMHALSHLLQQGCAGGPDACLHSSPEALMRPSLLVVCARAR